MQIVKWGTKQRQVKVPVGWAFVKSGERILDNDKFFNNVTHAWDNVSSVPPSELEGEEMVVGEAFDIVVREIRLSNEKRLDTDPHAVRMVDDI